MNIIIKFKKFAIIFLAVIIAFSSVYILPQQKAQAVGFGLAVPGGITIGAGTYVLGALALAGMVGLVGYDEHSDAINAHAKGVWEGGTQAAKDSLNWTIDQARGAGNALVGLQTDFQQFIDGKLTNIALSSVEIGSLAGVPDGTGFTFNKGYESINYMSGNENYGFLVENIRTGEVIESSALGVTLLSGNRLSLTGGVVTVTAEQYNEVRSLLQNATGYGTITTIIGRYAPQMAYAMGGVGDLRLGYQESYRKVQEAWEGMKDAGLVLPVDSAVPLNSVDGTPLTYNPTADSYTGIDGGLYTGTPAWAFPQPKIREVGGNITIPGVYVDTPVLTGNPAYDEAIVNNPAIPKTTTNVQTGVTVGNPDYATSTPIETPTPGGNVPPGSDWTKPPMKKPPNIGALVTTKFPFSLPWDFFGVLGWINAEPKAPVFKLHTGLKTPFGKELKMDMEFKFDFLDDYIGFFRSFIIIGFSLFLILATRRLLGGAG